MDDRLGRFVDKFILAVLLSVGNALLYALYVHTGIPSDVALLTLITLTVVVVCG